ncbi:MAG: class I SAM-dependent methyltransferase [Gemmatimonadetes bacterium]|nr:class I SAM-dependent methyltransferase [Gemmatimonadota bacterium]
MSHSVERHLGVASDSYDETIRKFIPGYEIMTMTAVAAVASARPALVIDLGSGTGALAERLLASTAETIVELWDVDEAMLGVARERLARFSDRARFVVRSFTDPLPPCDGVMASLSLHHLPTLEQKGVLYAEVARALRPGGVFANADVTIPADPDGHRASYRVWADHLVSCGIPEQRAWEHFAEWAAEDRYFSLEEELAALRLAGLPAECAWRSGPATVIVAAKATG